MTATETSSRRFFASWLNSRDEGARGVMVIVIDNWINGHSDTSSNPGQDWLHFTLH